MNDLEKLRVLLPHWAEHNAEHAGEFRTWAKRAKEAGDDQLAAQIVSAAEKMESANYDLEQAIMRMDEATPAASEAPDTPAHEMRILAIISGKYGQRHVNNIRARGPKTWHIETWTAPAALPPVIDYPEDYVPDTLPASDLILSFAEHKGVAELLPDIARITGAQAVIVGVDHEEWLPRGLARQLRGWLADINVACVTPKPLCSLTETHYNVRQHQQTYTDSTLPGNALIAEFASHFGQPDLRITVDQQTRTITDVEVKRDAFCGCAHFVAKGLIGVSVDEAEQKAGLLHHHYPCMAGMIKDIDFNDTLMHVSGNILKDLVGEQVRPYKKVIYIAPDKRSDT